MRRLWLVVGWVSVALVVAGSCLLAYGGWLAWDAAGIPKATAEKTIAEDRAEVAVVAGTLMLLVGVFGAGAAFTAYEESR